MFLLVNAHTATVATPDCASLTVDDSSSSTRPSRDENTNVRACVRRQCHCVQVQMEKRLAGRRGEERGFPNWFKASSSSTQTFFSSFSSSFFLAAAAVVFLVAQNEYFDVISRLVSFRWHTSPKVLSLFHPPRRCSDSFITLFLLLLNSLLSPFLPLFHPQFHSDDVDGDAAETRSERCVRHLQLAAAAAAAHRIPSFLPSIHPLTSSAGKFAVA